jgi:hypothetical protein
VASDLQTLRAALEAEPRDRACWAAYGDAFEDRYGQEARRALACRRVRDNAEFLALGADLDRLGVTRAEPAWPWPPGWAFCVQYRYGLPSYAALRDPIYVPRNLISHRLGTFGFLAFLQGPVRRVSGIRSMEDTHAYPGARTEHPPKPQPASRGHLGRGADVHGRHVRHAEAAKPRAVQA